MSIVPSTAPPAVPPREEITSKPHALYRFFDAAGALLYVGITHHPRNRWSQHRRDKPWWADIRTITIEPHPDRPSVLIAEAAAIAAEEPRYNAETRWEDPKWFHEVWDSPTRGTIAYAHEARDEIVLGIANIDAASVDNLVDLRTVLRDHHQHERGKTVRISVPNDCERGAGSGLLFGAQHGAEWDADRSCRFSVRFRVRAGAQLNRALREHFDHLVEVL